MIVHFICRGNVLRSVIAEAYLNGLKNSLKLDGLTVMSSGTVADIYRESNRGYIENARELLARHSLSDYAKHVPDQLTQDRLSGDQIVVCVNAIARDEAEHIVTLPPNTVTWDITDIGEGQRLAETEQQRQAYEEEIYDEVTEHVDTLLEQYGIA